VFAFVMRASDCGFRCALEIVAEFSEGVARDSGPRSGPRLGASEGGVSPLSPPKVGVPHSQFSQDSRARILASLEATNRRLRAIEATNRAASAALATACEPDRTAVPLLVVPPVEVLSVPSEARWAQNAQRLRKVYFRTVRK
jgi:hypothetical protein